MYVWTIADTFTWTVKDSHIYRNSSIMYYVIREKYRLNSWSRIRRKASSWCGTPVSSRARTSPCPRVGAVFWLTVWVLVSWSKPIDIKNIWTISWQNLPTKSPDKISLTLIIGKTLQVIALVHALLSHKTKTNVENVLILCPKTTILNWVSQFNRWLEKTDRMTRVNVMEISK